MLIARRLRHLKATVFCAAVNNRRYAAVTAHLSSEISSPHRPQVEALTTPALKALILSQFKNPKFRNLLRNVVASPSFLLIACHNLSRPTSNSPPRLSLDQVSTHFFDLQELSLELLSGKFDAALLCSPIHSVVNNKHHKPLLVPTLQLKVVIEALRIVLEVIYDDRSSTFSYGARVNAGRHSAVRYLKNSVENPSWWFSVKFGEGFAFCDKHVELLCLMLGEKIEDEEFVDLIRNLFRCGVITIDLSGTVLGRGFPQECGLSSILLNVYFSAFDREVQEWRLRVSEKNVKFDDDELVITGKSREDSNVFYKPLRIYAVRYLDEILIITSGSKKLALDLKNSAVKFLEENLQIRVDRQKTAVHSATSEKIDFMGMELQAVAPSILRPTMSEKAIRARKKYLRQKEVRLLELRNRRERNRKVLGMKLFSHIFKKSKRSNGLKLEFNIDREVRQIFSSWADEVVDEYFKSPDEFREWHRKLSAGDFLSLRKIRDQLPQELVDAYDNFQEQVEKYLNPAKAMEELNLKLKRKEEEEEEKYRTKTIDDLSKRCIKVEAPLDLLKKAVRIVGFTNNMGRPRPVSLLTALEDSDIIKWYAGVGRRWLDYFNCCHNFKKVKVIVTYHLRFSCILTLAEKHEATKKETLGHFTKDLIASGQAYFPTEREVRAMGDKNLLDPKPVDGVLTLALVRLALQEPSYKRCIAHFCVRNDAETYRIHLLQRHLGVSSSDSNEWVRGMGSIFDGVHGKCAPLCKDHASELYMGMLTLQDVDCSAFVDVD